MPAAKSAHPGGSLYGLYVLSLAACLIGNLLIRVGAQGGWLPPWGQVALAALYVNLRTAGVWTPRLDPPDVLMTPALLVAIGIALARRRYQ